MIVLGNCIDYPKKKEVPAKGEKEKAFAEWI